MTYALELTDLRKVYATGVEALRGINLAVEEGDLLAILSAGAYGMTMSSNYNTRPRAAEIIVDGEQAHLVRARETVDALFADENPL